LFHDHVTNAKLIALFAFIRDYILATTSDCCHQELVDRIKLIEGEGTALPHSEEDLFTVPRSHQLFSVFCQEKYLFPVDCKIFHYHEIE